MFGTFFHSSMLAPLPQLLPDLHQRLHLLRRGKPTVDHPAVLVGSIIESPYRVNTQMCQVAPQLVEILLGELFRLLGVRTAGHAGILPWRTKGEHRDEVRIL